jgi:subtilisin family serine protease
MRKRFLRKCVIGLLLLVMLATLTLVGSTSITQAQPPQGTVQIIVKFKSSNNSTAFAAAVQGSDNATPIAAAVRASGGRGLRDLPQLRTHVISVPANAAENVLAALANDPSVERAATAVKFHQAGTPDDPGYTQQWALPRIAWDQVYGTTPITGSATIAVLDTGVDAGHPDLAGRMGPGQSFVNGDANSDPNGHGTALAGIAAANVNNAVGIAGVAYDGVTVSSVQVLQPDGTGLDSDVIAGVVWAVDNGAKVILMGFSSPDYSAALEDALQYAWSNGAVLVAATGNDSSSAPSYPAGMENVLGVASTDQDDNVAAGSNTGSACVAAPGLNIYTTMAGGNYGATSGTSAAAAETAGLAALLVASGQSNNYIYNQIRGAVDPITGQSFGRINVATAMGEAVTPPPGPEPEPPPPPGPTPPVYAPAAARTASVSGNWSSTATWGWQSVPVAGDTVTINAGITVTVDMAAACTSIAILAANTINGITISGTNSLTVSGAITTTVPTANNRHTTIEVGTGSLSAGSIALAGAGTASRYTELTISTGSVTVTGNITSAGIASRITFSDAGTLNAGGTFMSGTAGTFTASTGTVNYNAAGAQTVGGYTYNNLTLSGSGAKTTTGVTVNGILSMEGTATASAAPTYGTNATLQYKSTTNPYTVGSEWITPFAATGGVIIATTSSNIIQLPSGTTKVFNTSIPLTINSGAMLKTQNSGLTFGGDFINNGTFTAGTTSSLITITGTANQSIAWGKPLVSTGNVVVTKTNGTATFTDNVSAAALTITSGNLNLGTNLTHTFTGVVTLTAGTLNGGSSTLNENMVSTTAWNGTGTVFSAGTGTVNFGAAGNQTLSASATTFNNLTFSGSGAKTMTNVTTINGNFTLSGTATAAPSSGLTIGGTVTLGTGTTFTGGSLTHNVAGNWINNGATVTLTGTTINLNGSSAQAISGSTGTTFNNLTLNNSAGLTISNNETVNGTLLFTSGKITTGSYKIIIGSSGSVSGGSISSYVNGYLQKNVATGATSRTFEVGATYYDPVQVDFVNVTTAGDLTVGTKAGQHPNIGSSTLNSSKDVNVYWTLTNSGIVFDNCNATFNFESGDILGGANTDFFIVGKFNAPTTWTYPTVGTKTITSTQTTGITPSGNFVVGEPIEFISFTVTDYGSDGIKFGSLDPGMIDRPADQNPPTQGAVTLAVYANVPIKVQLKSDNFTSPGGIIDIGNVKYNSSNTTSGARIMTTSYVTWYTVPAYTNNTTECYDWISIPAGQRSDNYTSTFYYQAIKSP